jgi:nitroreductase/uncharacterized protein YndB with AHSA1/START domain
MASSSPRFDSAAFDSAAFDPATFDPAVHGPIIDFGLTTTRGVRMRLDLERPVADQTILDSIDVAEQAPTGGNEGSRRWLIIRDQATKDRMAELYLEAGVNWVIDAAKRIEGSEHPNAKMMQGARRLGENLAEVPALVIPTIIGTHDGSGRPGLFDSVVQSAWSFMVALRARGLGSVWTTMYLNKADEVAELLGIPDTNTQICLLPVAYTKGLDFKPSPRRYPARDIAYFDRYGSTVGAQRAEERGEATGRVLADEPGVTVEVDIKAPPARVWHYVSDIDLPARFSEEFQGATWDSHPDDADAPAVGSVFTGNNQNDFMGEWSLPQFVTAWDPAREFAWNTSDPEAPGARWRYLLEKVPGGTRLRHQVTLGPGPSGLNAAIENRPDLEAAIIGSRQKSLRKNMQRVVEGIKDLAETAHERQDSGFPALGGKDAAS